MGSQDREQDDGPLCEPIPVLGDTAPLTVSREALVGIAMLAIGFMWVVVYREELIKLATLLNGKPTQSDADEPVVISPHTGCAEDTA